MATRRLALVGRRLLSGRAAPPATAAADAAPLQKFDPAWLQFLACPLTKKPLEYDEARQELVSRHIGVAFPIVRGIPRLVPTEGRLLDPAAGVTVPSPKENGGQ